MTKNTTLQAVDSRLADNIAERAYSLYIERGRIDGFDLDDWLRAERELRSSPRRASGAAATTRANTARARRL